MHKSPRTWLINKAISPILDRSLFSFYFLFHSALFFNYTNFFLICMVVYVWQLQSLLAIIDNPITKSGTVQSIYVKVDNGVLFEVKPHTRIPQAFIRTYGWVNPYPPFHNTSLWIKFLFSWIVKRLANGEAPHKLHK